MAGLERGPSLTDKAADHIRLRIVRGVFQLGEPLSEIALATELNVSKTPVREALMRLKGEGLVEVHPQRGTFVFAMTPDQVRKLSELRAILECAAMRLALEQNGPALVKAWTPIIAAMRAALDRFDAERYRRLDGEFHRALFALADNDYLLQAFNTIAFRVQALRSRLSRDAELNRTSFADHETMLRLADDKSPDAIAELLLRHIAWTREHYLAALSIPAPSSPALPRRYRSKSLAAARVQ